MITTFGQRLVLILAAIIAFGIAVVLVWKTLLGIALVGIVIACWRYYRDDLRRHTRFRARHRARRS